MRVLLIEDSARLSDYVARGLRKAGFAVDVAEDGERGLYLAEANEHDVIILDLMLPKRDGLSVLAELRERGSGVHVLILTAKDTLEDRVRGLGDGADDYLVKPFAFAEVLARIRALPHANGRPLPVCRRCQTELESAPARKRTGGLRTPLAAGLIRANASPADWKGTISL